MSYRPEPMPLARAGIDRNAPERLRADCLERMRRESTTRVVVASEGALAERGGRLALFSTAELAGLEGGWSFLGTDDGGTSYVSLAVDRVGREEVAAEGWLDTRHLGPQLSDLEIGLAVTALTLERWQRLHRHCPACGTALVLAESGWAARCPADSSMHYPRTDPAVIMAICDAEDRILLGRGAAWRDTRRFSILAGYVEAGESLEAAVRREVAEEAGVRVGDVRYLGNQPWPPSGSLMVAFVGEALSTELTMDTVELADVRWFSRTELDAAIGAGTLELPPPAAIARSVIDAWRAGELPVPGPA